MPLQPRYGPNVAIGSYTVVIDTKIEYVLPPTQFSFTVHNLKPGIHTAGVRIRDTSGSIPGTIHDYFTIEKPTIPAKKDSEFHYKGSTYLYVQEPGVTKDMFTLTATGMGHSGYMWTNSKLVDAEKDSETLTKYYEYNFSCWAAAGERIPLHSLPAAKSPSGLKTVLKPTGMRLPSPTPTAPTASK